MATARKIDTNAKIKLLKQNVTKNSQRRRSAIAQKKLISKISDTTYRRVKMVNKPRQEVNHEGYIRPWTLVVS